MSQIVLLQALSFGVAIFTALKLSTIAAYSVSNSFLFAHCFVQLIYSRERIAYFAKPSNTVRIAVPLIVIFLLSQYTFALQSKIYFGLHYALSECYATELGSFGTPVLMALRLLFFASVYSFGVSADYPFSLIKPEVALFASIFSLSQ